VLTANQRVEALRLEPSRCGNTQASQPRAVNAALTILGAAEAPGAAPPHEADLIAEGDQIQLLVAVEVTDRQRLDRPHPRADSITGDPNQEGRRRALRRETKKERVGVSGERTC
jgi:hypothetical protein